MCDISCLSCRGFLSSIWFLNQGFPPCRPLDPSVHWWKNSPGFQVSLSWFLMEHLQWNTTKADPTLCNSLDTWRTWMKCQYKKSAAIKKKEHHLPRLPIHPSVHPSVTFHPSLSLSPNGFLAYFQCLESRLMVASSISIVAFMVHMDWLHLFMTFPWVFT